LEKPPRISADIMMKGLGKIKEKIRKDSRGSGDQDIRQEISLFFLVSGLPGILFS